MLVKITPRKAVSHSSVLSEFIMIPLPLERSIIFAVKNRLLNYKLKLILVNWSFVLFSSIYTRGFVDKTETTMLFYLL